MPDQEEYLYSPVVSQTTAATFAVGSNLTWDSFWRLVYEKATAAIQRQANEMLKRKTITADEVRKLVESQRNELVVQLRQRLSPFGRRYSEILKPVDKLPTLEKLLANKGSLRAVLTSVGKSRASVNNIAFASRLLGPATIVIQITVSGMVISAASPEDRARVTSREVGGAGGAALAGWGGAWAGCATLSGLASPSLVVPIVGEVTMGGACLIGGIAGGFGAGWIGYILGQWAGEASYDFVSQLAWISE
jgi:hypothetical protein